jgi:hypothetical protein
LTLELNLSPPSCVGYFVSLRPSSALLDEHERAVNSIHADRESQRATGLLGGLSPYWTCVYNVGHRYTGNHSLNRGQHPQKKEKSEDTKHADRQIPESEYGIGLVQDSRLCRRKHASVPVITLDYTQEGTEHQCWRPSRFEPCSVVRSSLLELICVWSGGAHATAHVPPNERTVFFISSSNLGSEVISSKNGSSLTRNGVIVRASKAFPSHSKARFLLPNL